MNKNTFGHTNDLKKLQDIANEIRKIALNLVYKRNTSHIGSSLSVADILAALYFNILKIEPEDSISKNRDRFILSKGHACPALYATLALKGFFPLSMLDTFCVNGGRLGMHPNINCAPGIEIATGSLGHGLAIGEGMAIAGKRDGPKYRVFVLLGDGECNEGSVWESAMSAAHLNLDNLIAIVDYNKIQAFGNVKDVLDLEPFAKKWASFGWEAKEIDGHNMSEIVDALSNVPFKKGKPSVIIAHTIKGKGVSFMENMLLWHYKSPDDEQFKAAMEELKSK
jgi:transketolase